MAKQTKQKARIAQRNRRYHTVYWLLLLIGVVVAAFTFQAVALWLPWRWAYGFAANATVWPLMQLACSIVLLLVAVGLSYVMARASALVFGGLGIVTALPIVGAFMMFGQYAHDHDLSIDLLHQRHMIRAESAPDEQIEYGRVGEQSLWLSVYRNSDITKRSPTVVYVHGGGWSGGSRTENGEFFRWLNGLGYSVLSIDYRYANGQYASWRDAPRDVACALAWVNHNADARQINRDRVTLMGDSAGGQLALRAAYGVKSGDVSSSCGGTPIVPEKVAALVPAIDFYELYDDPVLGHTSRSNVVRYLGGTPESHRQAYDEASIMSHVASGLQPTLIINAANDTLVSPGSGERLARALAAKGVSVRQYTLPYAVHSYWINPGGPQNQMSRALLARFLEE